MKLLKAITGLKLHLAVLQLWGLETSLVKLLRVSKVKPMRLRQKILPIVGTTIVSLVTVLYTTSSTVLLGSFIQLEQQETRARVERVQKALDEEIFRVNLIATDWAEWDETYVFFDNSNQSYIDNNVDNLSLTNVQLNLVAFVNSSGEIVYGKFSEPTCQKCLPVGSDLQQHLASKELLRGDNAIAGLILLQRTPILIAVRPIRKTERSKSSHGVLILGRYLNRDAIARISERTHLDFALHAVNDDRLPADLQAARTALLQQQVLVRPLNEETIAGYTLIRDIYGQPAVIVSVKMPRNIYHQGQASIRYLFLCLLVVSVSVSAIVLLLLDRLVFSRLSSLSSNVRSLSTGDAVSQNIAANKDELSSLADAINHMLQALADSQYQQRAREERYYKYSKILTELAKRQTAENSDLNARLREITAAAADTLEVEYASVWVYSPGGRKLQCAALYQCSTAAYTTGMEWQASDYPGYFKALRQERALATADVRTEPKTKKMAERFLGKLGIGAMVNAPIYLNGRIVGIVCHGHKKTSRQWLIEEQNFTASIANLVALALSAWERQRSQVALQSAYDEVENRIRERTGELAEVNQQLRAEILACHITEKKLMHQASHDPLTGLANRTLFMQRLDSALDGSQQEHSLLAVLFVDLDRFKSVNDTLGHAIGDRLLIAISHRLQACLRPDDLVARLGGDEFTILLENIKNTNDAVHVAERIQRELNLPFHFGGHTIDTSASIGVAFNLTGYERPEDLLHKADLTMYRAKTTGKGRYEICDRNPVEQSARR
ncbi:diguanylate cyclase domain-containing protein [Chroococcidiopsis sp. CCNUC1]|uniref:diguanylate cyclase domain-containing protein n=1 Tax=Chroococcidiopsis sp. CCNUC1 TaxID=2653189 RepID=UPI0020208218|nr:diguanylate cyclase [Chroococcidiopsis sp. CCNUC1]URD50240.1 diguanylate cyclase [Chroococcidiopsis sp. CCNUC1]